MEKQYRKIEFGLGNIERAIQELARFKESGELVYGEFNGQKLYSDIDDVESAYKKITGKTKTEFDAARKKENDEYEEAKRKHEESIPELTKEWIEKGNAVLDEKYRDYWAKIVPIRLGDLYRGTELGCCIEVVSELNKGCSLDEAKTLLENQGHSGLSFGLVCSMIKSFCDRGVEFVSYAIL